MPPRFRQRTFSTPSYRSSTSIAGVLMLLTVLVVIAGVVFLGTADLAPPSETIEKVLPDERFPR